MENDSQSIATLQDALVGIDCERFEIRAVPFYELTCKTCGMGVGPVDYMEAVNFDRRHRRCRV